jgi:DNA-binding HxlR family transcriptional regulator
MAALDLLGRRWLLRLLWELRNGPLGARALLECCDGLSSSVFYQRLNDMTHAGLIEKTSDGTYALTQLGSDLGVALRPLDGWAKRWANKS